MPFLTGDGINSSLTKRAIFLPDNDWIIRSVLGALVELCNADNWEQFGTTTPNEIASAMIDVLDSWQVGESAVSREIGEIAMFASNALPEKWLWCDGLLYSPTDYPLLYEKIGIMYGGNASIPNFRTPNFQSRSPMGYGQGDGLSPRSMASMGGAESVTLTLDQIPSHAHGQRGNSGGSGAVRTAGILGSGDTNHATATQSAGGGQSHTNVHPYLTVRFAIYAGE